MGNNQLSLRNLNGLGIFALTAKALTVPQSESETLKRRDVRLEGNPTKARVRRRGLLERLDHWFWTQQQRSVEAYLAKATDVYDLEARIRGFERDLPHTHY